VGDWSLAQVIEHLPSKCKTYPGTTKKNAYKWEWIFSYVILAIYNREIKRPPRIATHKY
jgi:hypothetical protein